MQCRCQGTSDQKAFSILLSSPTFGRSKVSLNGACACDYCLFCLKRATSHSTATKLVQPCAGVRRVGARRLLPDGALQVRDGGVQNLIAAFAQSPDRPLDPDVRLHADALQLAAV